MSTNYSVQKIKLSDNSTINTNIDDFLNGISGKGIEIVKHENSKEDYFPIKDENGNHCWVQLDENRNVLDFWKYGQNNISNILDRFRYFLNFQYGEKTVLKYLSDYDINVNEIIIVHENDWCDFENEIYSKGKTVWNEIFTNWSWEEKVQQIKELEEDESY